MPSHGERSRAYSRKAPSWKGRWRNECESGARRRIGRLQQERRRNERDPVSAEEDVKWIAPHYGDGANWFPMNTDSICFCWWCPEGSRAKAGLQARQAANWFLFHPFNLSVNKVGLWTYRSLSVLLNFPASDTGSQNTSPRHIKTTFGRLHQDQLCR